MKAPPRRIETERLLLRAYEPEDTRAFSELVERNREHYGAFIAFFLEDPPARIQRYVDGFDAEESYGYGAFLGGALIGGGGLFPRIGPGALEIGYHLDSAAQGNGYATEIAAALAHAAFSDCGAERVELHIDPGNAASIGVAERIGAVKTGYDGDELIFSLVNSASDASVTSASASDSSSGG